LCVIVVVYDVNLYIIIIVTKRDGFRKVDIKMVFEKGVWVVDWIDLSEYKERGAAIVYAAENVRVQ